MKRYLQHSLRAFYLFLLLVPTGLLQAGNPGDFKYHKVTVAPPNWVIDPLAFEFNMSLMVRVHFNSISQQCTRQHGGCICGQ